MTCDGAAHLTQHWSFVQCIGNAYPCLSLTNAVFTVLPMWLACGLSTVLLTVKGQGLVYNIPLFVVDEGGVHDAFDMAGVNVVLTQTIGVGLHQGILNVAASIPRLHWHGRCVNRAESGWQMAVLHELCECHALGVLLADQGSDAFQVKMGVNWTWQARIACCCQCHLQDTLCWPLDVP